ncbi:MAG: hypothetical protein M5U28_15680 [Sandaracinaceae bacterium]|nr:hypothetical protein [Sandaracinaceae bacterium]
MIDDAVGREGKDRDEQQADAVGADVRAVVPAIAIAVEREAAAVEAKERGRARRERPRSAEAAVDDGVQRGILGGAARAAEHAVAAVEVAAALVPAPEDEQRVAVRIAQGGLELVVGRTGGPEVERGAEEAGGAVAPRGRLHHGPDLGHELRGVVAQLLALLIAGAHRGEPGIDLPEHVVLGHAPQRRERLGLLGPVAALGIGLEVLHVELAPERLERADQFLAGIHETPPRRPRGPAALRSARSLVGGCDSVRRPDPAESASRASPIDRTRSPPPMTGPR